MTRYFLGIVACGILLSCGQARAGLVAAWTFDSDFTAAVGGAAFDFTAVNGPSAGAAGGMFGNAASFSRASGQYAFTSGNVLTPGADFSYSAWYKLNVTDITGSNRYFVLETTRFDTPSGDAAWTASLGLRDQGAGDVMDVFTHPSQNIFDITGGNATDAQGDAIWHNTTITYNATTGDFNSYLDGVFFSTISDSRPRTAVEGLVIGGHRAGTGRNFEGLIDDVAFYDHVLDQGEVTALQTASANPIPEPGTLALAMLALAGLVAVCRRRRENRVLR